MFSRRGFIRVSSAAVGSLALRPFGLLPALAQSGPDYRALVCIFLYGGNDSNNTVLPMDDTDFQAYTSIRRQLALTPADLTTPTTVSGSPISFHGQLPSMAGLFSSKELAVIANVGPLVQPLTRTQYQQTGAPVPLNLFSHPDQQRAWETSYPQGYSTTGWAGRVADFIATQNYNANTIPMFLSTAGNNLLGTGASTQQIALVPGEPLSLAGFDNSAESQARYAAVTKLLTLNSGIALAQAANQTLSNSLADAQVLANALGKASPLKTVFPATELGAQLLQVAQVIQVQAALGMRRQIFFCQLGGFDTHADEMNTLFGLYAQLDPAIAAFYAATQELGVADSVTTFTESDFSRTLQPATDGGADHGWGGNHFARGGAVSGGQIFGQFPTFELGGPNDTDTRGRWIPTTASDQYGATLCEWFGVPNSVLPIIFPNIANFPTQKLGFLG